MQDHDQSHAEYPKETRSLAVSISKEKHKHSQHLESDDKQEEIKPSESQGIKLQVDIKRFKAQLQSVQVGQENIILPQQCVSILMP